MDGRNRVFPFILFAIFLLVIVLAGLWPFDFFPRNRARWIGDRDGLRLGRLSLVRGEKPVVGPRSPIRHGSPLTVELVVRPLRESRHHLSRIATFFDGDGEELISLGQWKTGLVLRTRRYPPDKADVYREIGVGGVLSKNEERHIAIVSNGSGTRIFIDGSLRREIPGYALLPPGGEAEGFLLLGNSPPGNGEWTGEIRFLALYARIQADSEVSRHALGWESEGTITWAPGETPDVFFPFGERNGRVARDGGPSGADLNIPERYRAVRKPVLSLAPASFRFDRSFLADLLVNILGFIPVGYLLSWVLRSDRGRRRPLAALLPVLLAAGAISLAIEMLQVFLPTRDSSSLDLLWNILGTAAGALLFRVVDPEPLLERIGVRRGQG